MYKYGRNARQKRQHHVQEVHNSRAERSHKDKLAERDVEMDELSVRDVIVHHKTGRHCQYWERGGNVKPERVVQYWKHDRRESWDTSLRRRIYNLADVNVQERLGRTDCYLVEVPRKELNKYIKRAIDDEEGKEMQSLRWIFRHELDILEKALEQFPVDPYNKQ